MLELLLLVSTILGPALAVFWLVMRYCGEGPDFRSKALSVFELHTEHGLIEQGLLWLAIGIPLSLGLAFGGWAWSGYEVSLTAAGYKTFFEISLLPIAIMSISLPLAGLVSRIHSTQQAANQITLSRTKNHLDAYYAHRKALFEYFKEFDDLVYFGQYTFSYKVHPVLHKRFFLGSPEAGTPVINEERFNRVERFITGAARSLRGVLEGSCTDSLTFYLEAGKDIYFAAETLHISTIHREMRERGVYVRYPRGDGAPTFGTSTLATLAALRFCKNLYDNLCDFSGRSRMTLTPELEEVFHKTEFWLDKGRFIEALHEGPIAELVANGRASLGDNHPSRQSSPAI
ncbi:hypothetical protein PPUJ20005_38470 [Pseudomonas putida]|uniref:hypothetical protein n=1 Tax=Pseudomonas putida TaxID=303 RepID=UPI00235D4AC3|nr:hypothetical protein [Pseudomonas putida]GLO09878.1 hypothetical protein PPUJ20005_38470 [Pseudomonas putida]HDS0987037.1 hypothetical protein [Pseudomonas putida]